MAKFAATVTVFFFVLAFSDAFSVPTRPENDAFVDDLTTKLPEHETEAVPGDANRQPGSVPEPVVEFKSGTYGSGSGSEIAKSGSSSSEKEASVPLTFVNFRPINRHFPKRPLAEFRFHRRPCRLHHHHRFHHRHQPWAPRVEIHYGQDMILSGGEKETGSDPVLSSVSQQIPVTWARTQEDVEKEREMMKKIMKKMHRRDHHRHHDHHHEEEEDHDEDEKKDEGEDHEEYKDWFMKKVRKFLKHQF